MQIRCLKNRQNEVDKMAFAHKKSYKQTNGFLVKPLFLLKTAFSIILTIILVNLTSISPAMAEDKPVPVSTDAIAIFAGGCFWCMESEFEDLRGVSDVTSGYAGGEGKKPTYEQVSSGTSGFVEAVAVTYDPAKVTYQQLLDIFWSNVDPFDAEGQFCDKGSQYVAAIFFSTKQEDILAQSSLMKIEKETGRKVATKILPQTTFYEAEDYHQDYSTRNTTRYNRYKKGCGRDDRLKEIWGND
jgi:peptide-methionine (S)-S-oxide reductase